MRPFRINQFTAVHTHFQVACRKLRREGGGAFDITEQPYRQHANTAQKHIKEPLAALNSMKTDSEILLLQ
jgi:hypothetical protein